MGAVQKKQKTFHSAECDGRKAIPKRLMRAQWTPPPLEMWPKGSPTGT